MTMGRVQEVCSQTADKAKWNFSPRLHLSGLPFLGSIFVVVYPYLPSPALSLSLSLPSFLSPALSSSSPSFFIPHSFLIFSDYNTFHTSSLSFGS